MVVWKLLITNPSSPRYALMCVLRSPLLILPACGHLQKILTEVEAGYECLPLNTREKPCRSCKYLLFSLPIYARHPNQYGINLTGTLRVSGYG